MVENLSMSVEQAGTVSSLMTFFLNEKGLLGEFTSTLDEPSLVVTVSVAGYMAGLGEEGFRRMRETAHVQSIANILAITGDDDG